MSSLGNDLSHLRKEQDITLEEVRDQTKISLNVLKSIEDDTIFTDFNENRTYIRSFVRSYAKALKIDDRIIKIALDQTEEGEYQDLLQKVDPYDPGEITDEPPFTIPEASKKKKSRKIRDRSKSQKDLSDQRQSRHDPAKIKDLSQQDGSTPESINWADVGQRFKSMENGSKIWIIIALIILVLGGSGYFFYYQSDSSPDTIASADSLASLEQEISTSDSIQLQMDTASPSTATEQSMTSDGLTDTLQLIVYAATGKLEPVRVKSDLFNEVFPYWLEEGQAMRFNFVDSIRIRGQYKRMALIFNRRQISDVLPKFYRESTGELHISRQFFEQDPIWRNTPADSMALNVAAPDTIMSRPTFDQE